VIQATNPLLRLPAVGDNEAMFEHAEIISPPPTRFFIRWRKRAQPLSSLSAEPLGAAASASRDGPRLNEKFRRDGETPKSNRRLPAVRNHAASTITPSEARSSTKRTLG
jgi:hypothetical protein